jgi:hypothetical protein
MILIALIIFCSVSEFLRWRDRTRLLVAIAALRVEVATLRRDLARNEQPAPAPVVIAAECDHAETTKRLTTLENQLRTFLKPVLR